MSTVIDLAPVDAPEPDPSAQADTVGTAQRLRAQWHRPSTHGWITGGIGVLTAVLYSWSLSAVGYANTYYAAAVKSATVSWKAFFFGSIDPGSFITVDKPPAALWVQALFTRVFGFSATTMIVPEVLAGIGSVLLLHHLVRRWRGDLAAHLAAVGLALTPIAVAMFRNNNPDAFLTLLGLAGAWALWNALETGRTRWLVASAAFTGLAFDTKMLQAFLVVPAFVLVYLLAGKPKLGRRLLQLVAALGALVVSAGWWALVVSLWPASSRPYIGSTSDNSVVSLMLGYNGLSRVFGGSGSSGGGGGGAGAGFGGASGWTRLFNTANGGQISWLLPLAGAGLLVGLWLSRHGRRTDTDRAGWLLWGLWAFTCLAIFSLSRGIFHPYYSVQLAPAVAALAGAGAVALWQLGRTRRWLAWLLPAAVIGTAWWAAQVLDRTPTFHATLRSLVVPIGAVAAVALLMASLTGRRWLTVGAGAVAMATVLAGPAAYAVTTVLHPVSGSLVAAGPATAGGGMGGGTARAGAPTGTRPTGADFTPPSGGAPTDGGQAPGTGTTGNAGGSGPGTSATASTELVQYLLTNRGSATYIVAAFGSQSSASIILATGEPVITIGGFNGGDPAPTLEQFEQLVASGQVRYLLAGGQGGGGGGGGQGSSSAITSWAQSVGTQVTVGSTTLYDLSAAVTAS